MRKPHITRKLVAVGAIALVAVYTGTSLLQTVPLWTAGTHSVPNLTTLTNRTSLHKVTGGGEGDNKDEAGSIKDYEAWFDHARRLPNGQIDTAGYQQAIAAAKAIPAAKTGKRTLLTVRSTKPAAATQSPTTLSKTTQAKSPQATSTIPSTSNVWTALGPLTIQDGQTFAQQDTQNVSGRVTSLAIGANNTLYAGGADGGVWRTTTGVQGSSADGSISWQALTDNLPSLAIGSVAVDPDNQQTIYAGTGEQHFSVDSYFGRGILKSTDGGSTWSVIGNSATVFNGQHISRVLVNQSNDSIIYAAADKGVYQSTNGGSTWTLIKQVNADGTPNPATEIAQPSDNPNVLYAAIWGTGIYKGTYANGSWSWKALGGGLPSSGFDNIEFAIAPSNSQVMYAAYSNENTDDLYGFYASTDGGVTWTQMNNTPDYFDVGWSYGEAEAGSGQGFYDNTLAVDPNNPQQVFAGGITLVETTDGGNSWTNVADPMAGTFDVHPDQHALTFDSQGNLFVGNDGGVWELAASGTTVDLNTNLAINQMYPGLSVYGDGEEILAGSQDNGTNMWNGALQSPWMHLLDGDGGYTAIDSNDPSTIYEETDNGTMIEANVNTGEQTNITPNYQDTSDVPYIVPFKVSASNSNDILVGADMLYRSTDGGTSYTAISPEFQYNGYLPDQITTFTQAPENSNIIYVGTELGSVYMTTTGGTHWTDITPSGADYNAAVTGIAVDKGSANAITVTYGGYSYPKSNDHVFYNPATSTNANNNHWLNVTGNLPNAPVDSIVQSGSTIYIGSDVGVFETGVGQASWTALNSGLPNTPVVDLELTANGTLYAATHGRGAFETAVSLPPALAVTGSQASIYAGNTEQLQAMYGTTDASKHAAWTSSNKAVATVSSSGVVTGIATGTATITASYEGEQATFTISVAVGNIQSVSVHLSSTHLTVKGASAALTVTANYTDGTSSDVTAGSTVHLSNSDIRVSGSNIYGMHSGTDTMTVSYQGHTTTLKVTVTAVLTSVTVSPASTHLYAYRTYHFTAYAYYNDGTKRTVTNSASWSTSSGSHARAYHGGLVKTRTAGSVKVYAKYEGETGVSSVVVK